MVADTPDVHPSRRGYDSPRRRERAQQTRAHVVATAGRLFADHGYAATSMRSIAAEAGVGLETVTQTGRKADLLLSAFRAEFAGSPDTIDLTTLVGTPSPDELEHAIHSAVTAVSELLRRSLGIWRAFTVAAHTDAKAAAVRAELAAARRRDVADWLVAYENSGALPQQSDTARDRLADLISLLVSHDAYDHLTGVCGWPHEDFVTWTSTAVAQQLRPY